MGGLERAGEALRASVPADFVYDVRRERQAQVLYADMHCDMRKGVFSSLLLGCVPATLSYVRNGPGPARIAATFLGSSMLAFSGYFLFKEPGYAGMDRQINLENSKRLNQAMNLAHPTAEL